MKPDSEVSGHGHVEIFKRESQILTIQTLSRVMVTSSSSKEVVNTFIGIVLQNATFQVINNFSLDS